LSDRIYVKTELFEGWATIIEYFPNEIYPIQVELNEPDADGHSLKHIGKSDIIKMEVSE
jgi:hypothetical protein